jgi:Fe2+ transport system protein B
VFEGKKTIVFWIGLLVLCSASLFLYSVFWTLFFYPSLYSMSSMFAAPVVVGGIFLILTGLILMKSGVKKQKSPTVF